MLNKDSTMGVWEKKYVWMNIKNKVKHFKILFILKPPKEQKLNM